MKPMWKVGALVLGIGTLVMGFQNCSGTKFSTDLKDYSLSSEIRTISSTGDSDPISVPVTPSPLADSTGLLKVYNLPVEKVDKNLYYLAAGTLPSLAIQMPAGAALDPFSVQLKKIAGNCSLRTPDVQPLSAAWRESASSGGTLNIGRLDELESRPFHAEFLQGCDFEISVKIIVNGAPVVLKAQLDALTCVDGEYTQLNMNVPFCRTFVKRNFNY